MADGEGPMTSWCDKLASTATIGLRLSPYVVACETTVTAWQPIFSRLATDRKLNFQVEQADLLSCSIATDDGFKYTANYSNIIIAFQHKMKVEQVSGGPPTMKLLSKPMPYTQLLDEVSDRIIEATFLSPGIADRKMMRIGIVSTTTVDEADLPPGITKFIGFLGRPWPNGLDNFALQATTKLSETPQTFDRCIYQLTRPEDEEKLFTLSVDWQRVFKSPATFGREWLTDKLDACKKSALEYFEDLAVGDMFDVGTTSNT